MSMPLVDAVGWCRWLVPLVGAVGWRRCSILLLDSLRKKESGSRVHLSTSNCTCTSTIAIAMRVVSWNVDMRGAAHLPSPDNCFAYWVPGESDNGLRTPAEREMRIVQDAMARMFVTPPPAVSGALRTFVTEAMADAFRKCVRETYGPAVASYTDSLLTSLLQRSTPDLLRDAKLVAAADWADRCLRFRPAPTSLWTDDRHYYLETETFTEFNNGGDSFWIQYWLRAVVNPGKLLKIPGAVLRVLGVEMEDGKIQTAACMVYLFAYDAIMIHTLNHTGHDWVEARKSALRQWKQRDHNLCRHVRGIGADVVCLQNVTYAAIVYAETQLTNYWIVYNWTTAPGQVICAAKCAFPDPPQHTRGVANSVHGLLVVPLSNDANDANDANGNAGGGSATPKPTHLWVGSYANNIANEMLSQTAAAAALGVLRALAGPDQPVVGGFDVQEGMVCQEFTKVSRSLGMQTLPMWQTFNVQCLPSTIQPQYQLASVTPVNVHERRGHVVFSADWMQYVGVRVRNRCASAIGASNAHVDALFPTADFPFRTASVETTLQMRDRDRERDCTSPITVPRDDCDNFNDSDGAQADSVAQSPAPPAMPAPPGSHASTVVVVPQPRHWRRIPLAPLDINLINGTRDNHDGGGAPQPPPPPAPRAAGDHRSGAPRHI
jgi:hypothetical protein